MSDDSPGHGFAADPRFNHGRVPCNASQLLAAECVDDELGSSRFGSARFEND
jgi:hypothetical protein